MSYRTDLDVLFPPRVIPALRNLRGQPWNELIDRISSQPSTSIERIAFVLMMVRLVGCVGCSPDSFRALRGCETCSKQTIRRFQGSDQDLLVLFSQAKDDIERFHTKG